MCFDEVTCGTRDLLAQAGSAIRYTINWAVQEKKVGLQRYLPADLPETAAKVPKINSQTAEEQSAPADPRVCAVEADVPDKPCPGKLARGSPAPAEPEVPAVEATAAKVPKINSQIAEEQSAPADPRVCA